MCSVVSTYTIIRVDLGEYLVSDCVLDVCGVGDTLEDAIQDYKAALSDYHQSVKNWCRSWRG